MYDGRNFLTTRRVGFLPQILRVFDLMLIDLDLGASHLCIKGSFFTTDYFVCSTFGLGSQILKRIFISEKQKMRTKTSKVILIAILPLSKLFT